MREGQEIPASARQDRGELGPDVARIWKKYHFRGEMPRPGSVAEQRMIALCNEYVNLAINPGEVRSSNVSRRELHNRLAVMILGETRTGLRQDLADDISNFAAEVAYGLPIEELYTLKEQKPELE